MMGREDAVVRIGTFCVDCSCPKYRTYLSFSSDP